MLLNKYTVFLIFFKWRKKDGKHTISDHNLRTQSLSKKKTFLFESLILNVYSVSV